jgi:hypothetical protein
LASGLAQGLRGKDGIKEITAWSGAEKVVDRGSPCDGGDGRSNEDMFVNLNAQSW